MRLLVCGSRDWTDFGRLDKILTALHPDVIIEGEARGADRMAREWSLANLGRKRTNLLRFPAKWDEYGKAAGPIRNQQMLDEGKPDAVVAFHDDYNSSKGTKDMVSRSVNQGLPVLLVGPCVTWIVWGKNNDYTDQLVSAGLSLDRRS